MAQYTITTKSQQISNFIFNKLNENTNFYNITLTQPYLNYNNTTFEINAQFSNLIDFELPYLQQLSNKYNSQITETFFYSSNEFYNRKYLPQ